MDCGEVQDRLPDRAGRMLDPAVAERVDRHLATCSECRDAFRVVEGLKGTRPAVPSDLQARILAAVRSDLGRVELRAAGSAPHSGDPVERGGGGGRRRLRLTPAWGLAAAAVLALAVGIPVIAPGDAGDPDDIPALALSEEGVAGVWLGDDLMVAGAPAVSELSDEALQTLLTELER